MSEATLIASTAKLTRLQLADVPTPLGTATHRPVPHVEVVETLGKSGSSERPWRSRIQAFSIFAVSGRRGVHRCFLPFPWQ
jgi:hypothetical protein